MNSLEGLLTPANQKIVTEIRSIVFNADGTFKAPQTEEEAFELSLLIEVHNEIVLEGVIGILNEINKGNS